MSPLTFSKGFNPMPDFEAAGFRPTSGFRTRAHQDYLRREGQTKTRNSAHMTGAAIDLEPPRGMSQRAAIRWAQQKYPGAKVIPTNGGNIHITFPGWTGAPDVSGSRRRFPDR